MLAKNSKLSYTINYHRSGFQKKSFTLDIFSQSKPIKSTTHG